MVGYSEKELHDLRLYDIIAADRSSVDANIKILMEKGQITIAPRQYLKKDGTLLDVEDACFSCILWRRDSLPCERH